MTALTRRHDKDPNRESWIIGYGGVDVGRIGTRSGVPLNQPQWEWQCGFGDITSTGVTHSFEAARTGFQKDWERLAPKLTDAKYQAWREQRDWTAWKYRMRDTGMKMPTQNTSGRSRCFCGFEITIASTEIHVKIDHQGIGTK